VLGTIESEYTGKIVPFTNYQNKKKIQSDDRLRLPSAALPFYIFFINYINFYQLNHTLN